MSSSCNYSPSQLTLFSKCVRRASQYCSPSRSFPLPSSCAPLLLKRHRLMNMASTRAVQSNDDSRPLANFHPNKWVDLFLLPESGEEYEQLIEGENKLSLKVGALIEGLKTELMINAIDHSFERLKMIDTIQLLGLQYHFEEEIHLALQDIKDSYTRTHLHPILPNLSTSSIGKQVDHALNYSNRRSIPRLEARKYISIYSQQVPRHENLLQLAKLDYNLLQSFHKRELSDVYSWLNNFKYARIRCVEMYLWSLRMYSEPQYSVARKYFSITAVFISILDDTFKAGGTLEELESLAKAIESWTIPSSTSLSGNRKLVYTTLWDLVKEIEEELVKSERGYCATYVKEGIKRITQVYNEEAKSREEKYKPDTREDTRKDYMIVDFKTGGVTAKVICSYIGISDTVTSDGFDWLLISPALIKATDILLRFIDVPAGHQHVVSQQEAINELKNHIEVARKNLNETLLMTTNIPLDRTINLTRIAETMYRKSDWYTNVGEEMQTYIKQLLMDPVPE